MLAFHPGRIARATALLTALVLVGMTWGCASSGLRGTEIRDLGRGTQRDISLAVQDEVAKQGYLLTTYTETSTRMYWETSWLIREPFEDEVSKGVDRIRTRVIIRAQRGASDFFLVTLRMENEATGLAPDGEWHRMPSTEMFRDHVRELSTAIELRIDAGMRTRGPPPTLP